MENNSDRKNLVIVNRPTGPRTLPSTQTVERHSRARIAFWYSLAALIYVSSFIVGALVFGFKIVKTQALKPAFGYSDWIAVSLLIETGSKVAGKLFL